MRGLFVAAGFCAHGLAGAGGIGKVMAEWIAEGEPSLDLWHMDIRRFGGHYRSPRYTLARTREVYETYYDIKFPRHEREAGRPLRVSPAYAWHCRHGAAFGEKSGWERVNWYEVNEAAGDEALRPRGWAGRHWSPAIGAEARACRETAALFDESSFAKLEVSGAGAAAFLERTDGEPRRPRVGQDHLHADAQPPRRDRVRLHRHAARGGPLRDRHRDCVRRPRPRLDPLPPAARGRRARRGRHLAVGVLRALGAARPRRSSPRCSPGRPVDAAFPYLTCARSTVGDVPVRALRVTYVGELGWELYCPAEYGAALWRTLWEAGEGHGLVAGGYRAIDALRLEKGYRVWGADITPDETPYQAGLGFAVKLDGRDFVGREALLRARADGAAPRLRCLVLDDPRAVALSNEPVRVGGADRGPRDERRLRLHASARRSPTRTCRRSTPRRAARSRSRSSASGSPGASSASRSSTRRANACGLSPASTDSRGAATPWITAMTDRPRTKGTHPEDARAIAPGGAHGAAASTDDRWSRS